MRLLVLVLSVLLVPLQLVDRLLEESVRIFIVLLVLLLLLLEEFELTLPQSPLFVELSLQVGVKPVGLIIFDFPLFGVLASTTFALRHGLLQFLILLAELHILLLEVDNEFLLAAFEILVLFAGDSRLTLMLRVRLLDGLFEIFEGFSLLLVLLVDVLLLRLDSGDPLGHGLGSVFLLLLEALLISLDRLTLLIVVLVDALLLESNLLLLEGTVSLEVDL